MLKCSSRTTSCSLTNICNIWHMLGSIDLQRTYAVKKIQLQDLLKFVICRVSTKQYFFIMTANWSLLQATYEMTIQLTWISRGWPWIPILRSIMQDPSVTNKEGNISKPSDKQRFKISFMPVWTSTLSCNA